VGGEYTAQLRRLALQKVLARVGGEPAEASEAAPSDTAMGGPRKRKGVAERAKEEVDAPQEDLPTVTVSEGPKRALSNLDARPTSVKAAGGAGAGERPAAKRVARGAAAVGGLWSYPSLRKKAEADAAAAASGVNGAGKAAVPEQPPTATAAKPVKQPSVAVASACPPIPRVCGSTATRAGADPTQTSEAVPSTSLSRVV
jgi:hypothetical protein